MPPIYRNLRLAGTGPDGKPLVGPLWHAVLIGQRAALCGTEPRINAMGWDEDELPCVTCLVCQAKLMELPS